MIDVARYSKLLSPYNRQFRLNDIFEAIESVEVAMEQIENHETAPWIRDFYYENLKAFFTPVVRNSTEILAHCTIESIEENRENLIKYYHDICSMTDNAIKKILDDSIETHKRIFSTSRRGDSEELVGINYENGLNFKDELYCVYFTKNCSLEEVEWFLEHNLKNELKTNAKIRKQRINTKSLKQRAFIGILTAYDEKPADILKFCNAYFGNSEESVTYVDIKRIKNRLSKEDWFRTAYEEKALIEHNSFYEAVHIDKRIITGNNKTERMNQVFGTPRYLKLYFHKYDNGMSLFQVERAE